MNPDHILDQLADEFEAACKRGDRLDVAAFLARVSGSQRAQFLGLLIPIEIEYRQQRGARVSAEDYRNLGDDAFRIAADCLQALPASGSGGASDGPAATGQTVEDLGKESTADSPTLDIPPASKPGGDTPTAPAIPSTARSTVIGPYKLLQQIGEGGMGEVWMAEQEKPVRRRVALKLIRADRVDRSYIARFEAERQALAMMDHQNIAKVLDAGTTASGQPYFVMELVQGIPFTQYCDKNKLSINERLELFIPVCKAVQHAHQKGIIHRDLKPSNVLVCLYDGKPVPKVIDFGLAKALEHTQKLTDKSMFTEFGAVVGSVQYMSPEQAELNQLDIDTRSDIYSLGVMLYELLTGSTPIEAETLKKNAILQVLATIREQDPPRPSTRLSSITHESASGISAQRQIETARLKSILRGELDWIVMKALEKDRTRRYETANGFANDIQNYLVGNVVSARPPSTAYRVRKYIRRNKGLVTSLASIAALLVAGIIGTTWFALQANASRKLADAKTVEVIEEKARVELERDKAREAEARAREAQLRADSERERAEESARVAEAAAESERTARLALLEETLELMKAKLGTDHPGTLDRMGNLAGGYWSARKLDLSIPLFEELLTLQRKKLGPDYPDTLLTMANLGVNYKGAGRIDEAIPLLEQAWQVLGKSPSEEWVGKQLLDAYAQGRRSDPFQKLAGEILKRARRRFTSESLELAGELVSLGDQYLRLQLHERAAELLREGLAIRQQKAPNLWSTFSAQSLLGGALLGLAAAAADGDEKSALLAEAEPLLVAGYEGMRERESTIPPQAANRIPDALDRLIELYTLRDKPDEAQKYRELRAAYRQPESGKEENR